MRWGWGWAVLAAAGFWMAVLGVLVRDEALASIGALVFGGYVWNVINEGRGE